MKEMKSMDPYEAEKEKYSNFSEKEKEFALYSGLSKREMAFIKFVYDRERKYRISIAVMAGIIAVISMLLIMRL